MSTKPQVIFLLETCTVLPGSDVAGRFVVDVFEKPFELTSVEVQLRGEEYSHVTVGIRENKLVFPAHYVHVDLRHNMYGVPKKNAKKGSEVMLEPGHHEFPFCFQLPLDAPPTYGWDAYECGSRVTYALRGSLHVPLRQSIHLLQRLTVLPTISFAQMQQLHDLVWSSPVQHIPVLKHHGRSKSKSEYMVARLQLCPSVVVVGSPVSARYYQEQLHARERGYRLPVAAGHLLGAFGDEEEDLFRHDSDSSGGGSGEASGGRRGSSKKRLSSSGKDVELPPRGKNAENDDDDRSDKDINDDDDDDENGDHDTALKPGESCAHVEEDPTVAPSLERDNAEPKMPLHGKLVRLYRLAEVTQTPFVPTTATAGVVCVRVTLENFTKDVLRTFTVSLRQLRETRLRKMHRSDKVTLSTVTVVLPEDRFCRIGESVTADVELPLRHRMHYEVSKRESWVGMRKADRRLPQPTLSTKYFSCQTFVEVTFPEGSLDKGKGQFHGCVHVVDIVGAPGTPQIPVPAIYAKRIEALS